MEEIYEITNKFYITYTKLFANQKISFHEYTIIENTIMRLQQAFTEKLEEVFAEGENLDLDAAHAREVPWVVVRNHHRLDSTFLHILIDHVKSLLVRASDREQILFCPVSRDLQTGIADQAHFILFGKLRAGRLRQICHIVDGAYLLDIQPLSDLLGSKARQSFFCNQRLQFIKILS